MQRKKKWEGGDIYWESARTGGGGGDGHALGKYGGAPAIELSSSPRRDHLRGHS